MSTLNENSAEAIAILRLIRTENVGSINFQNLVSLYGSAEEALQHVPELAKRGGRRAPINIPSMASVEKELESIHGYGAVALTYRDTRYPSMLKHIRDFPPVVIAKGNLELLERSCFAMVGSRGASANGLMLARKFATELGQSGYSVVSGLARGIDTAAHEGSFATGTVAVVAGGLDHIYPPENKILHHRIAQEGLLISEMPLGTIPRAQSFPRRNRIVSGISKGVLVVEASVKSGSLITARMALEQGREVFAIPGSPLDQRSQGANTLIKQGAHLVERVEDILDGLHQQSGFEEEGFSLFEHTHDHFQVANDRVEEGQTLEQAREAVTSLLGPAPVSVDYLINHTALSAKLVLTVLVELELAGRLTRHVGNKVSLTYAETALCD